MMGKQQVRREALRERRSISAVRNLELSTAIQRRVESLEEYTNARVLACYVAKSDEVQTRGILESALGSGKVVIVPKTDPARRRLTFHEIRSMDELMPGYLDVLEPSAGSAVFPLGEAQLVLVPVVAWDVNGGRMGYGRGYFDRELRSKGGAAAAGLAFESQRRERLPMARSDAFMDIIVTESRVVRCGGGSSA